MSSHTNNRSRPRGLMRTVRFPPDIVTNPVFTRTLRFQTTGSDAKGGDLITTDSVANLLWVLSVSASQGRRYFSAVRVREIAIWGVPSASAFNTVSIEWAGERTSNPTYTATGDNVKPASLRMRPPQQSLAAFWLNLAGEDSMDTGTPLFTLSSPTGSVLDLTFDFVVLDYDGSENANQTLTTTLVGSVGYVYYNYLDNTSPAGSSGTGHWAPLGPTSVGPAYGP